MAEVKVSRVNDTPILLAYAFRPFFLLTAFYGAALILAWIAFLYGGLPLPIGVNPMQWHAHEMLMGMVPAAIAGFLLTAMTNWTEAPPLKGGGLLALVAVWVAGRVVMWASAALPLWLVAFVDLLFLPALAAYAAQVLIAYGNRRNLVLIGLLALLTCSNLLMHLGLTGVWAQGGRVGEVLALDMIAVIMIVIGGRITPAFTANWLRRHGRDPSVVSRSEKLDQWAMLSALLMVPADLVLAAPWLGALAALAAGLINGWRVIRWRGWKVADEPLLWILHLGVAWVAVALLLKAATPLFDLNPSVWMHAMGAGAIGTLILGVMTRVSMGHTGRPIVLPKGALFTYIAITVAAAVRLAAAFAVVDARFGLVTSALAWAAAFVVFLALYWRVLSSPRADGRPG